MVMKGSKKFRDSLNKRSTLMTCEISGRRIRPSDSVVLTKFAKHYVRSQGFLVSNFLWYTKSEGDDIKAKILKAQETGNLNDKEVLQWLRKLLL